MAEKVTKMKLKVDLQCEKCYKKAKKLLCKFPQIRDQEYDEKHNMVTITVVCCNPEKIRDKLCCKGCGCIKCIEIVPPPASSSSSTPTPTSSSTPSSSTPPPPPPPPLVCVCVLVCLCPPAARQPVPVPFGVCCVPCYEGRPCFHGSGGPPPCFDGCYGRPVCDSYGGGRPCYVSRCDEYLSEENTSGCTIM